MSADLNHAYGADFRNKTIWLVGDVDKDMYRRLAINLAIMDRGGSTITIYLNTEGGCVTSARGIYSAIRRCRNRIRIVVEGEAASSGVWILQAADERIMTPEANLMTHIGSESSEDSHPMNDNARKAHDNTVGKWMKQVLFEKIKNKKPRYTMQKLNEFLLFDKYLTPKQALAMGLIDVIEERI